MVHYAVMIVQFVQTDCFVSQSCWAKLKERIMKLYTKKHNYILSLKVLGTYSICFTFHLQWLMQEMYTKR